MRTVLLASFALLLSISMALSAEESNNARPPVDDKDLQRWLENMIWYHRFTDEEIASATGLTVEESAAARNKFGILPKGRPERKPGDPLVVLPYPGGRHPRIGFLEGAIDPQRETKVSVFLPWSPDHYVVADIPEAIWLRFGQPDRILLYLAHTHVPTLWTKQNVTLKRLEWQRKDDGSLVMERTLPNQVTFGTRVWCTPQAVRMEMWLTNGSDQKLTGLRVQNCVMLKGAPEFAALTKENKVAFAPYSAVHDPQKKRWVIVAWTPNARNWGNDTCPCVHSDPEFPDCAPGETKRLQGWLSFYEGEDIEGEIKRIAATGWNQAK